MQSFNGRGFLFLQVLASVLLLALVATPAFSQASSTGTISGLVTDQQNAAVAGAEVTIVDTTTNIATKKTTNESGRYTFVEVPPSTYNITFAKAGFSTRRAAGQQIDVGQVLTMNAVLEVGATSSTVEVTAAVGAELQTMSATVGQTISGDDLMYLPNMGREASTLAIYQPGVSPEGSVAGAMYDQNTFQLDGGNNSNDMDGSMNVYTPSYASNGAPTGVMPTPIESIEEFKVATAGQTADFNGSSGSQVQMVTKRGSNSFHGSVYEYYYASDVGAANTWDNNWQGIPLPITHNNRYGAAIGGPLVPKKILGGKWYFFVNYEGFRFGQSALITKLVPSDLLRAGVVQISTGSGEQYLQPESDPGDGQRRDLPAGNLPGRELRSARNRPELAGVADLE
jgi:Tfp pilus assembly protein PilX